MEYLKAIIIRYCLDDWPYLILFSPYLWDDIWGNNRENKGDNTLKYVVKLVDKI